MPRKGRPGGSKAERSIETTEVSSVTGIQGGQTQLSWVHNSGGGTPTDRRVRQIGPHYLTLGLSFKIVEATEDKSTSRAA